MKDIIFDQRRTTTAENKQRMITTVPGHLYRAIGFLKAGAYEVVSATHASNLTHGTLYVNPHPKLHRPPPCHSFPFAISGVDESSLTWGKAISARGDGWILGHVSASFCGSYYSGDSVEYNRWKEAA